MLCGLMYKNLGKQKENGRTKTIVIGMQIDFYSFTGNIAKRQARVE